MHRKTKIFSALSLAALLLSGCALDGKRPVTNAQPVDAHIGTQTYFATDMLVDTTIQPLDRAEPVLVASLVDIDDLRRSSTLGRMVAEQVSGRLAHHRRPVPRRRGLSRTVRPLRRLRPRPHAPSQRTHAQ